jgi:AGCS family alanine or glycine:cation symporter
MLFAFTTLVSWSYYGAQAAAYLFGPSRAVDVTFKLTLCLMLSAGAAISLSSIIDFIDSMLFGMCIPNIIALYVLMPELRRDLAAYNLKYRTAPPQPKL